MSASTPSLPIPIRSSNALGSNNPPGGYRLELSSLPEKREAALCAGHVREVALKLTWFCCPDRKLHPLPICRSWDPGTAHIRVWRALALKANRLVFELWTHHLGLIVIWHFWAGVWHVLGTGWMLISSTSSLVSLSICTSFSPPCCCLALVDRGRLTPV